MRARRLAMRLALCAALGAATTVGVAWGIAYVIQRGGASDQSWDVSEERSRVGPGTVAASTVYRRVESALYHSAFTSVDRLRSLPPGTLEDVPSAPPTITLKRAAREYADIDASFLPFWAFEFGWPFRSLGGSYAAREDPVTSRIRTSDLLILHETFPSVPRDFPAFPYGPIPLGFAADTAIYAAAWWLLLLLPGAVRRRVRAARGRCTRCAYDLAGHSGGPCPECGMATPNRTADA